MYNEQCTMVYEQPTPTINCTGGHLVRPYLALIKVFNANQLKKRAFLLVLLAVRQLLLYLAF
jgi:hypothetical protein